MGILDWFQAFSLRWQLRTPDWSKRLQIIEQLGMMGRGASSAVRDLIPHLQSEHQVVRRATARALRAIGDARGLVAVGQAALEEARGPELPTLVDCLRHPDEDVRWGAVFALAHLGPAALPAVPSLVLCMSDPNEEVRRLAVEAIAKLGSSAEPTLTRLLTHDQLTVREAARDALVEIQRN